MVALPTPAVTDHYQSACLAYPSRFESVKLEATAIVPSMSSQVVIARVPGLAGRAAELRQLLADRAAAARDEPGCLDYEVAELLAEPATFLVVSTWESSDALRAHFGSGAHANYQHQVDELLARPSEVVVHEAAATTRPAPSTSPTDAGRYG